MAVGGCVTISEDALVIGYKRWRAQKYLLDRMTLRDLIRAYVTYPAIQVYALLAVVGLIVGIRMTTEVLPVLVAAAAAFLVYPLVWYLLHRYVLHGQWLYKMPFTAALWKRIHYDHHRNPNDLSVLFGGLHTTLPTILVVTFPIGWLIAGPAGAAIAVSAALLTTCFYEFCHCVQHLAFKPKLKFLIRIKRLHLAHHFHNEQGNFGITNYLWDKVLGTYYHKPSDVPLSATARNLGYAGEMCERYPWVARLTDEPEPQPTPRRERRLSQSHGSA